MRFYNTQHQFYCGIDLHTRSLYVCILNQDGETVVHRNLPADPDAFLSLVAPYREDIAIAVECTFTWYWLADLCAREKIPFVLGHALYMKAIHGGKTKNDRLDSRKIAGLLRGGMFPIACVYPAEMRGAPDLMRRRTYLVRKRADLLTHIQNSNSQNNLAALRPPIGEILPLTNWASYVLDAAPKVMLLRDFSVDRDQDEPKDRPKQTKAMVNWSLQEPKYQKVQGER
jgi:hypothetical protein